MSSSPQFLLSLESDGTDPQLLRRQVELLQRNLKSAGINVAPHRVENPGQEKIYEARSDPASLYTLGLTFISSGAAVALVNALRATFIAAHNKSVKFKLKLADKTVEISGDHLNGTQAQNLAELISQALPRIY